MKNAGNQENIEVTFIRVNVHLVLLRKVVK